jgi:type I restriction enzyme S subunit
LDFLNGAFGIVPPHLDGYESTLDLPAFDASSKINLLWFLYFVSRKAFYDSQLSLARGGRKAKRVNPDDFLSVKIPVPPRTEQDRIVERLSAIDAAIEKANAFIEQSKRLRQGLLQELLTRGIGHTKFKMTEIGEIPESWDVRSLGELAVTPESITYGVLKPGPFVPGGVPLLQIGDILGAKVDLGSCHRIGDALNNQYRRTQLSGGELLLSLVGTIGRVFLVPPELIGANIHRNLARIQFSETSNRDFVYHWLSSRSTIEKMIKASQGSSQSALNLSTLRSRLVAIPSCLNEKAKICNLLAKSEDMIRLEIEGRQRLLVLKEGVARDLLTGQKRILS